MFKFLVAISILMTTGSLSHASSLNLDLYEVGDIVVKSHKRFRDSNLVWVDEIVENKDGTKRCKSGMDLSNVFLEELETHPVSIFGRVCLDEGIFYPVSKVESVNQALVSPWFGRDYTLTVGDKVFCEGARAPGIISSIWTSHTDNKSFVEVGQMPWVAGSIQSKFLAEDCTPE